MTRELLQNANQLVRTISSLESQIMIVEDMHRCDKSMTLEVDTVGTMTIAWDDELKDDIIDLVLKRLNKTRDDMEDKLRLL